jgi:hypothetical protein
MKNSILNLFSSVALLKKRCRGANTKQRSTLTFTNDLAGSAGLRPRGRRSRGQMESVYKVQMLSESDTLGQDLKTNQ